MTITVADFARESNEIEGIYEGDRHDSHTVALKMMIGLEGVSLEDICAFVKHIQPDAALRELPGMNVAVGGRMCPTSGPVIKTRLMDLLGDINAMVLDPQDAHVRYELLHPFMDGNGRSGRALWLWQMAQNNFITKGKMPYGFLQMFYYQTLSAAAEGF